eukprot:12854638-Alexandrium_andersonii.AAC.1
MCIRDSSRDLLTPQDHANQPECPDCWARAGRVLGARWVRAGRVMGACWALAGHVLGAHWARA